MYIKYSIKCKECSAAALYLLLFVPCSPMYIASSDYNDHQVVAQNLRDNIEDLLYVSYCRPGPALADLCVCVGMVLGIGSLSNKLTFPVAK